MNEFRHDEGAVVRIFPQPEGSRMVFEDDKGHLYVFNPVNDQVMSSADDGHDLILEQQLK